MASTRPLPTPCGQGALKGEGVLWIEVVLKWKDCSLDMVRWKGARCDEEEKLLCCIHKSEIERWLMTVSCMRETENDVV